MTSQPSESVPDPPTLDRVETLFFAALSRPEQDREAYLARECANDPRCREHVLALLRAHPPAQQVIRTPADATTGDGGFTAASLVGQRIGRFVIRGLIGSGGMGVVYQAQQTEPVRRMVALKIIKWGMDTEQVLARFEAERQTLAMMEHANIAQIYDAGATEAGRPYFVMELVPGVPITQHCDEQRLDMRQRLELFMLVCSAVQHAHQKGIIHRDIKPSNVLVAIRDGQPIPKVIDFGVAKATNARFTERNTFTEFRQLIGTPEYMSPEQAGMDASGIDTRSDIYSLGVLLYELLTGTTPFDGRSLRRAGYHEIQRVIREEDPQRPSTRLSALGANAGEIAGRRLADARTLRRLLRGDLDWIVMKCLEKDRSRRYETATGLASDVQRHLRNEAVTATPHSAAYLLRKFARRNRAVVIAGGVIALAIIGGGVTALFGMWQAMYERDLKGAALSNEQAARRDADAQRDAADFREYVATVRGAGMAIAVGSNADAVSALWSVPERLRGWEWQHLLAIADVSLASVEAHSERVTTTVFSPDQRTLATSSFDRRILMWDMDSLHPRALRGCTGATNAMAFSPDGLRLVSGEDPSAGHGALRIWDVTSCQMVAERAYDSGVRCVAWSSGNRIASDASDGFIRLWDPALPDPILTFQARTSKINALAFSPDGTRLASVGEDAALHVWDVATGRHLATRPASHEWLRALAWHPSEPRIALSGAGGAIVIWDPDTGKDVRTLLGHKQFVWRLDFSPDGSMLASGGEDCMLRVWDTSTGTLLHSLGGHRMMITALDFSPDGNTIATGGNDSLIKLWDLRFAQSVPMIETGGHVTGLAFGLSDASLACGMSRGDIRLVDPFDFTLQRTIQAGGTALNRLAYEPSGRLLASPSENQTIHIWDSASGQRLQSMTGRTSPATDLRFLPGLHTLVSTSEDQAHDWPPPMNAACSRFGMCNVVRHYGAFRSALSRSINWCSPQMAPGSSAGGTTEPSGSWKRSAAMRSSCSGHTRARSGRWR